MKTFLSTITTLLVIIVLMPACHKNAVPEETIFTVLRYNCSEEKRGSGVRICYDSLTSDSRCPEGAICVWAGYAEIKVRFQERGNMHAFKMMYLAGNEQHHNFSGVVSDTTINGYKIKLMDVLPHPKNGGTVPVQDQYKAIFSIGR